MSLSLFQEFPSVWEQFEQKIRIKFLEQFPADGAYRPETCPHALSELYRRLGSDYWSDSSGEGHSWFRQFADLFWDYQYNKYLDKLYFYKELDTLAARRFQWLPKSMTASPENVYVRVLKPYLDARKHEIQKDFIYLKIRLHLPVPYTLTLPETQKEKKVFLTFRNAYQKDSGTTDLENYSFCFHKRIYPNVDALWEKDIEELSENMFLGQDVFGERVLKIYTQIPVFDSGDRIWDSGVLEYLFFDGQAVNLLVLQGGYRISSLTFYETSLTKNLRLKPYLKKLGWSMGITWPKSLAAWLIGLCIRLIS